MFQNTQIYQSQATAFDFIYQRTYTKYTSELYYS